MKFHQLAVQVSKDGQLSRTTLVDGRYTHFDVSSFIPVLNTRMYDFRYLIISHYLQDCIIFQHPYALLVCPIVQVVC